MTPLVAALTINQGETFIKVVRWETEPYVYKAITGQIAKTAPCTIPCTGHGLTNGWRVAPVSLQGMVELNALGDSQGHPRDPQDFHACRVVDANTIALDDVNPSGFSDHVAATGYLQFWTPQSLVGYTARMQIKDKVGGAVMLSLTTENGGIFIDDTNKTITITITDVQSAALTKGGVYDLEMVSGAAVVTRVMEGRVTLRPEVTT